MAAPEYLQTLDIDMDNISSLSRLPNKDDELSYKDLQKLFDKAGNDIKTFINETMLADIEQGIAQHGQGGTNKIDGGYIKVNTIPPNRLENNCLTADQIAPYAIDTEQIASGAITYDKLDTDSVRTVKIKDDNVTSEKLNSTSGSEAVTTDVIRDEAVTTDKIDDDAVTTAKIADVNVTTAKIADDAITAAKINDSGYHPIADAYNSETVYSAGDYCIYNNTLWKRLVAGSGTTPTEGSTWTATTVPAAIAEAKSYTDDYRWTLLWTNSSPTETFESQVVTISNLSEYKVLMILSYLDVEGSYPCTDRSTDVIFKYDIYYGTLEARDENRNVYTRYVYVSSTTSIDFSNGYKSSTAGSRYMVPIRIYGMKL